MATAGGESGSKTLSEVQQEQVLRCLPLARALVRPYARMFPHLAEDLRQEAFVAVLEAIHRFDPSHKVPVEAWVTFRVKGALATHLGSRSELTKTERDKLQDVRSWEEDAERRLGHPPSRSEVARAVLRAAAIPPWILREVRSRRSERWKSFANDLKESMQGDPTESLVAAGLGAASLDEFMNGAPTETEIAEALEGARVLGNRETISSEDMFAAESRVPAATAIGASNQAELLFIDECFRALPTKEQVILRFVLAQVPMAFAQRALGVAQASAYRLAASGMARLGTLLSARETRGGGPHGREDRIG